MIEIRMIDTIDDTPPLASYRFTFVICIKQRSTYLEDFFYSLEVSVFDACIKERPFEIHDILTN